MFIVDIKKGKKVEIHYFKKPISSEEIDNILSSAMAGITYWADGVDIVEHGKDGVQYLSDTISHGGTIKIHTIDDDEWHELNLAKLLKGLSITEHTNFEDYDMHDADIVIQNSLFGKQVYA